MTEDHLLLRVPDDLQVILDKNLSSDKPVPVYYEREHGRNYVFVIGKKC